MDVEKLLMALAEEAEVQNGVTRRALPAELRKRLAALQQEEQFGVGDLVVWKDGLKNYKFPNYGEPAIVTEVYREPIINQSSSPVDPDFREPITVKLGVIVRGRFIEFGFDGRWFRKLTPEELKEIENA